MAATRTQDDRILWYLRHDGLIRGPYTSATLRRLMLDDEAMRTAEVSLDKQDWRQVLDVPEVLPPSLRNGGKAALKPSRWPARPRILLFMVILLILVLLLGLAAWFLPKTAQHSSENPDCTATPAPGINWNNCRLPAIKASNTDLQRLKASNADLHLAQLDGANLSGADLSYANLNRANLAYANLADANLKGANLTQADLSYANLTNADLSFANLSGAKLGNTRLESAKLDQALMDQAPDQDQTDSSSTSDTSGKTP